MTSHKKNDGCFYFNIIEELPYFCVAGHGITDSEAREQFNYNDYKLMKNNWKYNFDDKMALCEYILECPRCNWIAPSVISNARMDNSDKDDIRKMFCKKCGKESTKKPNKGETISHFID